MAKLRIGDRAPAFTLDDEHGTAVSLASALERGPVVLIFYPMDDTPGCTAQLRAASSDAARFARAGITVYGVNNASAASHRRFSEKHRLETGLLVDPRLDVAARYDAVFSLGAIRFIKRTVAGIAADGTLAFYRRGTPSTDDILGAFATVSEPCAS